MLGLGDPIAGSATSVMGPRTPRSSAALLITIAMALNVCTVDVRRICEEGCLSDIPKNKDWMHDSAWLPVCNNRNEGVDIIIRNNNIKITSYQCIVLGRIILCNLDYNGLQWRIFNVYGPAIKKDRKEALEDLKMFLPGRSPTLFVSDFNTIRTATDRERSDESGPDVTSHFSESDPYRLLSERCSPGGGRKKIFDIVLRFWQL